MKQILGSTKENFYIEQDFWCDYGYNIEAVGNPCKVLKEIK